jgi:hypothetical protein
MLKKSILFNFCLNQSNLESLKKNRFIQQHCLYLKFFTSLVEDEKNLKLKIKTEPLIIYPL